MRSTLTLAALATVLVPAVAALAAGSGVFDLEIGDPKRKGQQVAVVLDGITDTTNGELLTPQELAERLGDTVTAMVLRDAQTISVAVTVAPRSYSLATAPGMRPPFVGSGVQRFQAVVWGR